MNQTNLAYNEWEEKRPIEMVAGRVVMLAQPGIGHIRAARNIHFIFEKFLEDRPCESFPDGVKVFLTEKDRFVPDMTVVCDKEKVKRDGIHGAPDLVVEVLSPSTMKNDFGRKKDVYGQCGVREYWIVSPNEQSIQQYLREDGTLVLHDVYAVRPDWELEGMEPEEREAVVTAFPCGIFPELEIRLADVFRNVTSG